MQHIEDYFNIHSGRVFILGNGPSLNDYDLSKLIPDQVITMNRSWKVSPGALYHCVSGDLRTNIIPPQHILFLGQRSQYPEFKLKCPIILVQTRIFGITIEPKTKTLPVPDRIDLRNGWFTTHCGLFAVYAAWWLGFREMYLLGYDGYGGHFNEEDKDLVPDHARIVSEFVEYVEVLLGNDPNLWIYNCNLENAYRNLPLADFDKLV